MTPWRAPVAASPLVATVVVPGSKSATARALVLALLADGPSAIAGGLVARDSDLMKGACRALGAIIDDSDPDRWVVTPPARFSAGADIDCGLAGTVARFVPPVAALAEGMTKFHGDPAASQRPIKPLLGGLRQTYVRIDGDALPFAVYGPMVSPAVITIDSSASSQFVSGLLLSGARMPGGLELRHVGDPIPSMPYIALTVADLRSRGVEVETGEWSWRIAPSAIAARDVVVQPDLMNAAAFLAAAIATGGEITVRGWPDDDGLPGADVPEILARFGGVARRDAGGLTMTAPVGLHGAGHLDLHETSELTPVAAALAALASEPTTITGVAHIRGHETDRLAALAQELTALGGDVTERSDGLEIRPAALHAGTFHTYADHRLAHAGALLGLAVDAIDLDDVTCTSKTMPTFGDVWQGMAA